MPPYEFTHIGFASCLTNVLNIYKFSPNKISAGIFFSVTALRAGVEIQPPLLSCRHHAPDLFVKHFLSRLMLIFCLGAAATQINAGELVILNRLLLRIRGSVTCLVLGSAKLTASCSIVVSKVNVDICHLVKV